MKKYFLVVVVVIFVSCKEIRSMENNIYFEEVQPTNDSELIKIPSKFIGTFMYKDSVILKIDKNSIAYQNNYKVRIHKNELDSLQDEVVFKDGKYFEKNTNIFLENKIVGDSIEFILKDTDTIFEFSEKQKAKRINGKLILNTKDSIYWTIKILTLDKNKLTIQELNADADLQAIDSVLKIKAKPIEDLNYLVNPSRKEFVKIIKIKSLGSRVKLERIK